MATEVRCENPTSCRGIKGGAGPCAQACGCPRNLETARERVLSESVRRVLPTPWFES